MADNRRRRQSAGVEPKLEIAAPKFKYGTSGHGNVKLILRAIIDDLGIIHREAKCLSPGMLV